MALKLSQIRNAFKEQIETVSGFKLMNVLPDYFGRARESIAHKGFVVACNISSEENERQRRSVGVYVSTTVVVNFAYRLRPLDVYPTDYDLFLNAEESVILACLNSYQSIQNEVQVRYNNSNRQSTASNEYMLSTINFTVKHTIGD
jgi:hypothetical protein